MAASLQTSSLEIYNAYAFSRILLHKVTKEGLIEDEANDLSEVDKDHTYYFVKYY